MIELAIDDCCADCPSFEIEDVRTEVGDHILMCALRGVCYSKRKAVDILKGDNIDGREKKTEAQGR